MTNEDGVKMGCILESEGFLRLHDHSDGSKKIIKAFEDNVLLYFFTFDYRKAFKKEVAEFYVTDVIEGDGMIKS